jgi:hypothetical protein
MLKYLKRRSLDKKEFCVWMRDFALFCPSSPKTFKNVTLECIRGKSKLTMQPVVVDEDPSGEMIQKMTSISKDNNRILYDVSFLQMSTFYLNKEEQKNEGAEDHFKKLFRIVLWGTNNGKRIQIGFVEFDLSSYVG